MNKILFIMLALFFVAGTADVSAQNFLKKVEKSAKKELEKRVEKEVKKGVNKGMNKVMDLPSESSNSKSKTNKKQESPSKESAVKVKPGEKKFVKNIDVYYKNGMVQGNYKLYYDGATYYIGYSDEPIKLIPCDGTYSDEKYYFYFEPFKDIELLIKENLPGAVGKRVVKDGDKELEENRKKYQKNK